jgi:hypothetical protein
MNIIVIFLFLNINTNHLTKHYMSQPTTTQPTEKYRVTCVEA